MERFAAMFIFLKKQLFSVLLQHIGAGKILLADIQNVEDGTVMASFKKKHVMLFHNSNFEKFKLRFTILCKVLESKSSNNRDYLVKWTQKVVRMKEMFEL